MIRRVAQYSGELSVALLRISSIAVGPITALAIASRLSLVEQGYYFSFVSILAARAVFDAGVAQVIVNTTGQEGSSLAVDRKSGVSGPADAVASVRDIFHFAIGWYGAAAVAMLLFVGAGGYAFFASSAHADVNWQWPWIFFVVLGSIDFALQAFWTLLEGLNQIVHIYLMRSVKAIASVLALASIIFLNGGLWSVVGYMAAAVVVNLVLIFSWRALFTFLAKASGGSLSWRQAIWPFQWRMAVSWAGGYLAIPLFVPIVFRVTGPAAAGKVGMTMAIVTAAASLSQSVIDAKVPYFCGVIAARQWNELDRRFFRRGMVSILLFLATLAAGVIAILVFEMLGIHFTSRIVSWPIFALFAGGALVNQVISLEAIYMRCHRREPMMWPSIIGGLIAAPATYILVVHFGGAGVGISYLGLSMFFGLPVATTILIVIRSRWHVLAA